MSVKKATVTVEGTTLTLTFAHGEELTLDANDLPNEQKQNCLMHGMKQKVCDSYSGVSTPQEALEKASGVVEGLLQNLWSVRGTGEGGTRVTQLARALSMVTGQSIEEAVDLVSEMEDDVKKALGQNVEIKKAIAAIQAEKAREAAEAAANSEGPSIADILAGNRADEEAA